MNDKWISIKDRLPEESGPYIVFVPTMDEKKPYIGMAWFEVEGTGNLEGWQLLPTIFCEAITHWMELPDPPSNLGR